MLQLFRQATLRLFTSDVNMAAQKVPLLVQIVASSVCVSQRAAKIIRDVMSKGDLGIIQKTGIKDLQTQADRSAQRCIMASLHKNFPKIAIFGEEDLDPREPIENDWVETKMSEEVLALADKLPEELRNIKDEDIVVWVDPLDGTAEYTEGLLDHVTTLIGVGVKGVAEGGVIYQPYYNYQNPGEKQGRCIWGIRGIGSYGFTKCPPPEGQNIITTTRSHSCGTVVEAVDACEPTEVLRVGGAGHKVLLVIEGKAHAYVFASPGCKKWDTAAPEAVLKALGGKLTDIHGAQIMYHQNVQRRNTGGVLAVADENKHEWYLERIPDQVKEALPTKI